ncbi:MAG: redox-regulated ATPase YchF [Chloroflexi bacterium]|nr:redox-regulated ATPase YchF [Chloroflexota bacterium]
MDIAIAGFPLAGKTTVFNALAHARADVQTFGASSSPNLATVKVPDERIEKLATVFKPKKIVPAEVRYVDVAGWQPPDEGERRVAESIPAAVLASLRQADALLLVVRSFANETVPLARSQVDPVADARSLAEELLLADLMVIERRQERLDRELKSAPAAERAAKASEFEIMKRLRDELSAGRPARVIELTPDEEKMLRGYGLLSLKPTIFIVNGDDDLAGAGDVVKAIEAAQPFPKSAALALPGRLEMELGEMDPAEAAEFREELGAGESAVGNVVQTCYRLLERMSFLTAGEDECRAWEIRTGATAVEAAGAIHSDLARGFIRAEVINWEDLIAAGGYVEARKLGKLRSEGKTYVVRDGDVLTILFNV